MIKEINTVIGLVRTSFILSGGFFFKTTFVFVLAINCFVKMLECQWERIVLLIFLSLWNKFITMSLRWIRLTLELTFVNFCI